MNRERLRSIFPFPTCNLNNLNGNNQRSFATHSSEAEPGFRISLCAFATLCLCA
jgi:hypothetical protein